MSSSEDDTQEISRRPGDGSLGVESVLRDAHVSKFDGTGNDGRSSTRTYFKQDDDPINPKGPPQAHRDPDDRRTWGTLAAWNDGVGDPGRGSANWSAWMRRDARAYADGVGLSRVERNRVVDISDDINMQRISVPTTPPAEHIILAICSLVRDENVNGVGVRAEELDGFQELRAQHYMDDDELEQIRNQLLDKFRSKFDTESIDDR